MFFLKKILASLILPPLGPLLLAFAGIWLAGRRPRAGRILAALACGLLLLLSEPWLADRLMDAIEDLAPITPAQLSAVQAIVILGGGSYHQAPEYGGDDTVGKATLERLRYGARLARQSGLPVLVTGGAPFGGRPEADAMQETLEREFQVAVLWTETQSRDTAENATLSAPLLQAAGVTRIALVTHAFHMARAKGLFEGAGFEVTPAPTAFSGRGRSALESILPSTDALSQSYWALHETLGRMAAR
jgi:uncharacterized SAM-binding protein YcdF (DUF218 family)